MGIVALIQQAWVRSMLPKILRQSKLWCACVVAYLAAASATAIARDVYVSRPACDAVSVNYKPDPDVNYVPRGMVDQHGEWREELDDGEPAQEVLNMRLPLAASDVLQVERYNLPDGTEEMTSVGTVQVMSDGTANVRTIFDGTKSEHEDCAPKRR